MAFTNIEVQQINSVMGSYCQGRIPEHLWSELEIRFRVDGQAVTVYERRPTFQIPGKFTECAVARFRYNRQTRLWTLYWADRNLRWHIYERIKPARNLKVLVEEVERDPTGIFWG